MMSKLLGYSGQQMSDPTAAMAPIRNAGLQGINQQYAALPDQVASQMARRGYGSSGSMGNSMYKVGLARAGAASDLEGQLATKGIDQQNFGASLGTQLLNAGKGTSTTATGTTSTSGSTSSTGTATKPGPSILSSLAGLAGLLLGGPAGGAIGSSVGGLFGGGGGSGGGNYSYDPNAPYNGG